MEEKGWEMIYFLLFFSEVNSLVLIIDGNSEHGAHALTKTGRF